MPWLYYRILVSNYNRSISPSLLESYLKVKGKIDPPKMNMEILPDIRSIRLRYVDDGNPTDRDISFFEGVVTIPVFKEDFRGINGLLRVSVTAIASLARCMNQGTVSMIIDQILCSMDAPMAVQKNQAISRDELGIPIEYSTALNILYDYNMIPILNFFDIVYQLSPETHKKLSKWLKDLILREPGDAKIPPVTAFERKKNGPAIIAIYIGEHYEPTDPYLSPDHYYIDTINRSSKTGYVILLARGVIRVPQAVSIMKQWLTSDGAECQGYPIGYDTKKSYSPEGKGVIHTDKAIVGVHVLLTKKPSMSEQAKLPIHSKPTEGLPIFYVADAVDEMRTIEKSIESKYATPTKSGQAISYRLRITQLLRRFIPR